MKERLRAHFAAVLRDLRVDRALARFSPQLRGWANDGPLLVLAFGKAARAMARTTVELLPHARLRGLVVPPEPDAAPLPPFEVIAGGHPLPSVGSLRAGARALELARSAQPDESVVFLVSGGGSSLLELPGDANVTLPELRALYQALVASGADIASINTIRRHLSAVKGGRLALAAEGARHQVTMVVSDVPGPQHDVASGPSLGDSSTPADCRALLDRFRLWDAVPMALRRGLEQGTLPPAIAVDHRLVRSATECYVVLDQTSALQSMDERLHGDGMHVTVLEGIDDWPYERAAARLLEQLDASNRQHPGRPVAVIAAGELSVPLPREHGTGGRNQQFALHVAQAIAGQPITALSCGTDGLDGNSPAAGAIVDGTTMWRARELGLDVADALRRCDAFPLLHALGDAVITGPTGTNVRDLRVLVHTG